MTHDILKEAFFPTKLKPYPLDFAKQTIKTWQQIETDPNIKKDGNIAKTALSYSTATGAELTDYLMVGYAKHVNQF